MKLLAKSPEDRYQTASGVEQDLRRCLADWQSRGRIEDFPLGEHDVSDRLLIPERLYGRSREIDSMLAAFDRVVVDGAPELVLVSGYSGIGKSSVVDELQKALVPTRGLFASGKFDQHKRDIPYATLAQAFQSLVRPLLGKSPAELQIWRDALEEALVPNGLLMLDIVPELKLVLAPLARQDLERLIADTVHCTLERAAPLAQLVHEKTGGNPFFAIQFISELAHEGLLTFDHRTSQWSWDLTRIYAKGYTDNIIDLMVGKLNRLTVETQTALQQLACMGNRVEFDS